MKIKYDYPDFNPKRFNRQNIYRLVIERIKPHSLILDVGCATGYLGQYLMKEKDCWVCGLEKDKEATKVAQKRLGKIIIGDIEDKEMIKKIIKAMRGVKFDNILAVELIEHLKDHSQVLINLKSLLKPTGYFIATVPNITHWSVRLALLKGEFDYQDYGILDNTHLHFFTSKNFKKLFVDCGFEIKELVIDPVGGGYPRISRFLAKFFPNLFAYQMLIVAKIKK